MSITTRISNITDPHMGLLTPWKQRFEEMRARQLAKTHSDEIDRQIKEEAKAAPFNQQAIILLMSIPKYEEEASTFIGQMKLVHGDDWRKDPADFRPEIWKILLENARSVVKAVKTQNVWPSGHANRANCEYIMSHRIDTDNPQFVFQPRFAQAVKDLWVEEVISALLDWPPCLALHDSDNAAYFVSEAHRIVADNYVPTMEDITHITKKGVMKAYIKAQQLSVQILQWHGHRGIPQKWAHLFEGTTSIVFYASLSGYDRPSADRNQQSHLEESLILFEEVVNSRWFSQTSVILFLTEVKEFKLKLLKVPLCQYFPDYVDDTDGDKGAQYICSQFSRRKRAPLTLYIHFTEVSDISNVRLVTNTLADTILQNLLTALKIL